MAFFPAFGAALGALGQATEGTFEKMQAMRQARQQAQLTEGQIAAMPWHQRLLQSQVGGAEAAAKQAGEQRGIYKGMQEVLGDPTLSAEDRVRKLAGLAAGIPKVAEKAGEAATKSMVGGAVPYSKGGPLDEAISLANKDHKNFNQLPPDEQAIYFQRGKSEHLRKQTESRVQVLTASASVGVMRKDAEVISKVEPELAKMVQVFERYETVSKTLSRLRGNNPGLFNLPLNLAIRWLATLDPEAANALEAMRAQKATFGPMVRTLEQLSSRVPVAEVNLAASTMPDENLTLEQNMARIAEGRRILTRAIRVLRLEKDSIRRREEQIQRAYGGMAPSMVAPDIVLPPEAQASDEYEVVEP